MIKITPPYYIFLLLFSVVTLRAQTDDCEEPFVYYYGEGADYHARTLLTQDTFLYLGGQSGNDAFLSKMTTNGTLIWTQKMTPYNSWPNAIVDLKIASDGTLIGCGQAREGGDIESFAFKIAPDDGAVVWTQTYEDPNTDYFAASDIYETSSNPDTYTLLGTAYNNTATNTGCDAAFYSIDRTNGNIASERIHFHLGSCEGIQSTICLEGTFFTTGRYNFANGGFNRMRSAVSSFNATGTPLWSRLYLVDVNQDARMYSDDIAIDGVDRLVVLGRGDDDGVSSGTPDIFLYTISQTIGGLQWARKYTLPENVLSQEVTVVENGYLIIANARDSDRTYVMRVNGIGTPIWGKRLDGIKTDGVGDEVVVNNDLAYLAGQYIGTTNNHAALLRFNIETGDLPNDCIPNIDFTPVMSAIPSAYDGFNSLSTYNTAVSEAGSFELEALSLEELPTSCGPACGPEICDNGIDDDGDGLVDCDDPDVADDCCCYEAPILNLGVEGNICAGNELEIDAGTGFETYEWSDGSDGQTLIASNGGFYSVTVTDICEIQQIDTFLVNILPSFSSSQNITICEGESTVIFGNPENEPGQYSMTFTASNGCDSMHTVTLTVLEAFDTSENRTICEGTSTEVFGQPVSDSGDYSMTFTASSGCDSTHTISIAVVDIILTSESRSICQGNSTDVFGQPVTESGDYSMTFTASGGCDSTHTVSVVVLDVFTTSESLSICEGSSIEVFGQPVTESGDYSMTFTASGGCDSIHTVSVVVLDVFTTSESLSICEGNSTEIFGQTVTEAGDYSMTFTASNGCDSTHTVSVAVLDVFSTSESLSICEGSSTEIFGQTVTEAGDYSMTFTASNGCDSTHTVSLAVLEVLTTSESLSICEGSSTEIFGQTVTEAGDYSMTFTASNGCDSTHTVSVAILEVLTTSENLNICEGSSTEIFGQTVTEAGDYSMTFTASNGCDSMHTVSVTVLENITTSESFEDLCAEAGVEVFGEFITEAGVYEQSYTAANGCDSTHTVTVSFLTPNITTEEITICPDESIDIFGETVTEEGVYSATFTASNGCDSTHVITLISETFDVYANIFPPCPGDPMEGWLAHIRTQGNGGPYSVTYNGQLAYSNTIGGLQIGDHTVQVTSANGCEYTFEFTIHDPDQPWSPLVASIPTNNEPNGGSIQMEVADGLGPISFSIDGVNFYEKPVFEGLSKGEYPLYVNYGGYCSFCTFVNVPGLSDEQAASTIELTNIDEFSTFNPPSFAVEGNGLQLYPNPTKQSFRLYGVENVELKTIRLLSLTGNPLKSWNAVQAGTILSLPGDLPGGVYLVQTITVDGTMEYLKLIVSR